MSLKAELTSLLAIVFFLGSGVLILAQQLPFAGILFAATFPIVVIILVAKLAGLLSNRTEALSLRLLRIFSLDLSRKQEIEESEEMEP